MTRLTRTLVLVALAALLATAAIAETDGPLSLPVDTRLFDEGPGDCLTVANLGSDSIAEYLDAGGQVVFRAASWLGRAARYVLRPPRAGEVAIQLVSLRGTRLDPADYRIRSCPAGMTAAVVEPLATAQNLRLARYLGDSVELDSIESALLATIARLDEASGESAVPMDWQAVIHYETGAFYRGLNRLSEAKAHLHQARAAFAAAEDAAGLATAVNALGLVAWREGRSTAALSALNEALEIRQRLEDRYAIAEVSNNLGLLQTQQGDLAPAMQSYELALEIFQGPVDLHLPIDPTRVARQADMHPKAVFLPAALNTLNNLALLQRDRGLTDLAERYWRNYLALESHVPRALAGAEARSNLGRMLLRLGRLDEALVLLADAQAQFEAADVPRWEATTAVALSHLYGLMGDDDSAGRYGELAVTAAGEDVSVAADARLALGMLARRDGNYERAMEQLGRSADDFGRSGSPPRQRLALIEKAWVRYLDGQVDAALDEHRGLLRELEDPAGARLAAIVQSRMAEILWARGHPDQAEELLLDALQAHQAAGDLFSEFETLERLGRIQAGQPSAIETNRRAIERIEDVRAQDLPLLRQAEFFATRRSVYDRQVQALLEVGEVASAWRVADSARARGLRELRQAHSRSRNQPEREALLDERASLVAQKAGWAAGLIKETDSESEWADEGLALDRQLDQVEARLRYLERDGNASPAGPGLAEVQAGLRRDQLLVSYYTGAKQSAVWVIRSDKVRAMQLPGANTLTPAINELLAGLRHPRRALGQASRRAEALRQLLIEPYEAELSAAHELLIQADGVLHSLPFRLLLPTKASSALPVSHILAAGPGLSSLNTGRAERSLLLMADPGWSGEISAQPVFPEESLLARLIRDSNFGNLPGTRREAEAIAALARDSTRVQMQLGTRASRDFVLGGGLSGHDLVHLATHGLVDLQYPQLSALLLAGESSLGPAFLRPHDIAELELGAELVVLSGCETGHGRILAGEGAMSLARPFHIAGARQVLASLWKIDDHRTALFMERFYRHLLIDRNSAAEALARAQAATRQDPATSHPYYWAGFVLSRSQVDG